MNILREKIKSNDSSGKGKLSAAACVIRTLLNGSSNFEAVSTALLGSTASINLTLGAMNLDHRPVPHPKSRTIASLVSIVLSKIC